MSNFECQSCGTYLEDGEEVKKHKREYGHPNYKMKKYKFQGDAVEKENEQ